MITPIRAIIVVAIAAFHSIAIGGELNRNYFGAVQPGDWVSQELTAPDGSKSTYTTQRLPDVDGRIVVEFGVKVIAGAGEGSESKTIVHLPADFNFARDWLSYGKFTEKMSMEYSGMAMPIDDATLEIIRDSSKDYRGAVTFAGTETIDGYECDHYTYTVPVAGATPQNEVGDLWLNDTVPFGIVRQSAKMIAADGTEVSSYDIRLTDKGREEMEGTAADESSASEPEIPAGPIEVGLLEGYQSELFAFEISAVPETGGRKLEIMLRNKSDREITVSIEAGDLVIPGSMPVEELLITIDQNMNLLIPAQKNSLVMVVDQRGSYGPVEGSFTLSYYEGTAYFTGSVTVDNLSE